MNPTLQVRCPEQRCQAEVGEHCLRLNRPNFPGERTVRQSHSVRVEAARLPRTAKALAKHPGLTDASWTGPTGLGLFLTLANTIGLRQANDLWHAAHDLIEESSA